MLGYRKSRYFLKTIHCLCAASAVIALGLLFAGASSLAGLVGGLATVVHLVGSETNAGMD